AWATPEVERTSAVVAASSSNVQPSSLGAPMRLKVTLSHDSVKSDCRWERAPEGARSCVGLARVSRRPRALRAPGRREAAPEAKREGRAPGTPAALWPAHETHGDRLHLV